MKQFNRRISQGNKNLLRAGDRDVDDAYQLLDELKDKRLVIQRRLTALRRSKRDPITYAETAIAELSKLKRILVSSDPCRVRHVIQLIINKVTVWIDRPRRLANSVVSLVEIKLCEDCSAGFTRGE